MKKTAEEILRKQDLILHPDDPWSDSAWNELIKTDPVIKAQLQAMHEYAAQFRQEWVKTSETNEFPDEYHRVLVSLYSGTMIVAFRFENKWLREGDGVNMTYLVEKWQHLPPNEDEK